MSSESKLPSPNDVQQPQESDLSAALTAAQRNFAQVVGQALAEAWRNHLQHSGCRDSSPEGAS